MNRRLWSVLGSDVMCFEPQRDILNNNVASLLYSLERKCHRVLSASPFIGCSMGGQVVPHPVTQIILWAPRYCQGHSLHTTEASPGPPMQP